MKDRDFARLYSLASTIGHTLQQKNLAYGDSFSKTPKLLEILYPDGVRPEQYPNMLTLVRMLDKINRIANQDSRTTDAEDPFTDLAGYAILAQVLLESKKLDTKEAIAKSCKEAADRIYAECKGSNNG
jgi:hypothetical protein